jgi:hypothetical protein
MQEFPMSIETMMCLSTGHVAKETAEALDRWVGYQGAEEYALADLDVPEWTHSLILYPHGEYGWLICIGGDAVDHMRSDGAFDDMPKDLVDCLTHAHTSGCSWLLLDRDADLTDELPSFDW